MKLYEVKTLLTLCILEKYASKKRWQKYELYARRIYPPNMSHFKNIVAGKL